MKLEDMFNGIINNPKKGMFLLLSQMEQKVVDIQRAGENDNLSSFKSKIAEGHELIRKFEALFVNIETKLANLTVDELGKIIDLSVAPERRA